MEVTMSARAPRRQLTQVEFFQLCDLLRANRDFLVGKMVSVRQVTEWAEGSMLIEIPQSTVQKAMTAIVLELPKPVTPKTASEARMEQIEADIKTIVTYLTSRGTPSHSQAFDAMHELSARLGV